jgi:hypothetical protein
METPGCFACPDGVFRIIAAWSDEELELWQFVCIRAQKTTAAAAGVLFALSLSLSLTRVPLSVALSSLAARDASTLPFSISLDSKHFSVISIFYFSLSPSQKQEAA